MEYLIGIFIISAYALGQYARERENVALRAENAHLREMLFRSRGYDVRPVKKVETETVEIPDDKPHLNMNVPKMWDVASHKPPDLFESRRKALYEDSKAVQEGKKEATL